MQFRTEIQPLGGCRGLIGHGHPLLLIGSCFSDNIGRELADDLFDVTVNPFGPLYNPESILRAFEILENGTVPERFCESDGRWLSFDSHSRVSAHEGDELRRRLAATVERTAMVLRKSEVVIVTLGTTRVFRLKSDGLVVANCHKQPGRIFEEARLGLGETARILGRTVSAIRRANPHATVMFTVSPLRYPGDDPHSNTLSKSMLHLAVAETADSYDGVIYFPAYEIMMDDLRDYRFYADDMRHPSAMAVSYIYEKFSQSFFDADTQSLCAQCRRLTRRLGHITDAPRDIASWPEASIIQSHPELKEAYQRYLSYGV